MKKKLNAKLVIFDLDGTLVDSKIDIANSLIKTLKVMDVSCPSDHAIDAQVGLGVKPLLEQSMISAGKEHEMPKAIEVFRATYLRDMLKNSTLYDGILEMLQQFSSAGKVMTIASNKPYQYVEKMVKGLGIGGFFSLVLGGDSLPTNKPEPEMLLAALQHTGYKAEDAVFIGDSGVDIEAGKNSGIRTVGALYGYRTRQEITSLNPDVLIEKAEEIATVIV